MIRATVENAEKLLDALLDANLGTASFTSIQDPVETEITVFEDRLRIDVQTLIPGIYFEKAWKNRQLMNYRSLEFYVVAKEDLIASKLAAGRKVELEDVRLLTMKPQ